MEDFGRGGGGKKRGSLDRVVLTSLRVEEERKTRGRETRKQSRKMWKKS